MASFNNPLNGPGGRSSFFWPEIGKTIVETVTMDKNMYQNNRMVMSMLLILSITCLAFCAGKPTTSSKTSRTNTTTSPRATVDATLASGLEDDILALINNHRRAKGLPALQMNGEITAEARKHTMAMATRRIDFGHAGFNIRNRIILSKVPGTTAVAENVAFGSKTAKEVVAGWLSSSGHRKNIEGNYKLTGIGVARDKNATLFYTQIFAR